jgi:2-oxoisovalerate dehydrogenase E1 component alpha subunit
LRVLLEKRDVWNAAKEEALLNDCAIQVDEAVKEYLSMLPQPLTAMFDYLYEKLPEAYADQRAYFADKENAHG